ncbi:MAG: segregation and condensation protein A [Bacillota bacterium]|jgi:segregation and condensation protein A|nr:segregation/condensation protein A [Clostridia bacterium]
MKYHVKLEVFEGPFDLLFHLIEKNEVDIYDIPIAEITRQYIEYMDSMQKLDLELASEFLVMAATLLSIKAKMLLPKEPKPMGCDSNDTGVDPRDELVDRLLEYKKYKIMAEYLGSLEAKQGKVFARPNDMESFISLFDDTNPLEGLTLLDLVKALQEVWTKKEHEEQFQEIPREEISIKEKMDEIIDILDHSQGVSFQALFAHQAGRTEIVVQFLALLELVRLQMVTVRQSATWGEIMIFTRNKNNCKLMK